MHDHPIGSRGGFLQLIAKIMSVPECCARIPATRKPIVVNCEAIEG